MRKLLFSMALLFVVQAGYAQSYYDIIVLAWQGPGVSLPDTKIWLEFYENGAIKLTKTGVSDSVNYGIYHDSIPITFTYDSLLTYAFDCNGVRHEGSTSPHTPTPWGHVDDTVFMPCTSGPSVCTVDLTIRQTGGKPFTVDFEDRTLASGNPNSTFQRYCFFGDGDSALVSANFTHTYPGPGTYYLTYNYQEKDTTSSGRICFVSHRDTVIVNSCQANYEVDTSNSGNGRAVIINNSVPFQNAPGYNISYLWDFGDGDTSSQAYPTHTYTNAGKYNICLTITADSSGNVCTSTFCDSLGVDSLGNLLYKTTGAGFVLEVKGPELSVTGQTLGSFELYPNPVKDILSLKATDGEFTNVGWTISDIKGASLLSGRLEQTQKENFLDLSNLGSGIYFLNLQSEGQTLGNFKVLKN